MTKADLEELLDTIAAKARSLRDAGVSGPVTIGDIAFVLEPRDPPDTGASTTTEGEGDDTRKSALNQRITFGGREVPSRRRVEDPYDR